MVIILLIAAIISAVLGNARSSIVIFAVVTMNAILGTVQHIKAQHSLESLKALSAPSAKVLRDGVKKGNSVKRGCCRRYSFNRSRGHD